jgi:hypothetical protein
VTSSSGGISCGTGATCSAFYDLGTSVTLTPTVTGGNFHFAGACLGAACSLAMDADKTASAIWTAFNYIFVTSGQKVGATLATGGFTGLTGPDGADAACQAQAQAAGLPGTFKAWLSTSTVNAKDRFPGARGWVRVDGLPFTDTITALTGTGQVFYPPALNANGTLVQTYVRTATQASGLATNDHCADMTSASAPAPQSGSGVGSSWGGSGEWTFWGGGACNFSNPIFCMGSDLNGTVTVSPSSGRKAFISVMPFTPGTGVGAADQICQNEGAALAPGKTFKAFMGTTSQSPVAHAAGTGTLPWVRPDGVLLANNAADLFNKSIRLLASWSVRSDGTYVLAPYGVAAWIGSADVMMPGTAAENCNNWSSTVSTDFGRIGDPGDTLSSRFSPVFYGAQIHCATSLKLYCLQQEN